MVRKTPIPTMLDMLKADACRSERLLTSSGAGGVGETETPEPSLEDDEEGEDTGFSS